MLRAIRNQNRSVEIIKAPMRTGVDNFDLDAKINNFSIKEVGAFDRNKGLSSSSKVLRKNKKTENDANQAYVTNKSSLQQVPTYTDIPLAIHVSRKQVTPQPHDTQNTKNQRKSPNFIKSRT